MLEVPQHKEIASCQNTLVRNLQYCTKNQQFSTWNKGYKLRKKGLMCDIRKKKSYPHIQLKNKFSFQ